MRAHIGTLAIAAALLSGCVELADEPLAGLGPAVAETPTLPHSADQVANPAQPAAAVGVVLEPANLGIAPPPSEPAQPDTNEPEVVIPEVDEPETTPVDPWLTCELNECGNDVHGASCGSCANGSSCLGGVCHEPCDVPDVPRGAQVGQVLTDLQLRDCDGNPVTTDGLCGFQAVVLYNHCSWCPIAVSYGSQAADLAADYEPKGVKIVLVVTSSKTGGAPTSQTCKDVRTTYPGGHTVLFDPTGQWNKNIADDPAMTLVIGESDNMPNTVVLRGLQKSWQTWLRPALDALVSP